MNRTLLLILCDFLLLNLLALTRWEQAEPSRAKPTPAAASDAAGEARTAQQDVVEVMRLSLEDERSSREQLEERLGSSQQTLAQLEAERSALSANLGQAQQSAEQLRQQVADASRDATLSRERLAQLQRDLEQREAEANRQREELERLAREQTEARQRLQQLDVAVKVAEQEKAILRETADTYRAQAEQERVERMRVQESTTQLAQGVGQLAEKSAQISREMRDYRPINANTLFNEFLINRVPTRIRAERSGLFGAVTRDADARTILVADGEQTYALIHLDDTPFALVEPYADWGRIEATVSRGNNRSAVTEIQFLAADPRIVALPLTAAQVEALGVKVYQTAVDPFRFAEAVLISNGGQGYGETPFKLEPTNPNYVRMDNRLVRRLLGDFSASRGDLVLSKTGELLGIMVTADSCVLISEIRPWRTLPTGEVGNTRTSTLFAELAARLGVRRPSTNR